MEVVWLFVLTSQTRGRVDLRTAAVAAHRDRLVEVCLLAQHGAKLQRLIVVGMFLATRRRAGVYLRVGDAGQVRDRGATAGGARTCLLRCPQSATALTVTCLGCRVFHLHGVQNALDLRHVDLVVALPNAGVVVGHEFRCLDWVLGAQQVAISLCFGRGCGQQHNLTDLVSSVGGLDPLERLLLFRRSQTEFRNGVLQLWVELFLLL